MQLTFAVPITTRACNIARMEDSIGKRIARFRTAAGLSQSELARRLHVKPQAVQKWEAGGSPRARRLEEIAFELGVDTAVLMGGSPVAATIDESPRVANGESWPFSASRERFDALDPAAKITIDISVSAMIEAHYAALPRAKTGS